MRDNPEYEIIPAGNAYYVIRVVGGYGQVIDRFSTQSAAEDFMGFLVHVNAVSRLLVDERAHRHWTKKLVA